MSLRLMKERMKQSGISARDEMLIDGQSLIKEELEHDVSYSPTMFIYNPADGCDDRPANMRIYDRKYSSLNGNYQHFLTAHDNPIKIGDYLHDAKDDTYWLVYNAFNVNDVHYEGKMIQCNYKLKWRLPNGSIVSRWANIVSASKYDVGENGNSVIMVSTNTYTVLIGYCEEGFELEGRRVFIDMNADKPTKVFKITRSDDVLYNSGSMGKLLSFIADKKTFNPNIDNQELGVCDYPYLSFSASHSPLPPLPPDETADLSAAIKGNANLKNGYSRTYSIEFRDKNGNAIDYGDVDFEWKASSDFEVEQKTYGNKIELGVNDENAIDSFILLQAAVNGIIAAEIKVKIVE